MYMHIYTCVQIHGFRRKQIPDYLSDVRGGITSPSRGRGYTGGGVYNFRLRQRNQTGHRERFKPESLGKLGPIVKDVICIIWPDHLADQRHLL